MPSLTDLDVGLLLQIAALVGLESAGRLSIVNKHVCAAITPVLPSLCDVTALRLILPFFATRTSDPVLVEHFWRRQIWWGVVFEVESEYIPLAASPVASHGQLYPITYRRRYFGFPEISFDVPFDRNGRCVPQPRCCRVFTHAISGTHRPPELDQGVINTILRGATEAWASKKASYTVEAYLQQHPAESVPLRYVARDIEPFADFAPRRVAQDRLQRCIEQSSNAFLMQLGSKDLAVVAVALREAFENEEIDNDHKSLAKAVFSYHGDVQ